MKVESPEVAALVDVLNRWDPVFFLDSHTHNGSYHQEPVTWVWGLNPNGDQAIADYMSSHDVAGDRAVDAGDVQDGRDPARRLRRRAGS